MQRKKYYDLYELYTREEMSEIANKEGFLFVETSNGDNYEIRKSDVADFIVLEAERCGHAVDIKMYVPKGGSFSIGRSPVVKVLYKLAPCFIQTGAFNYFKRRPPKPSAAKPLSNLRTLGANAPSIFRTLTPAGRVHITNKKPARGSRFFI